MLFVKGAVEKPRLFNLFKHRKSCMRVAAPGSGAMSIKKEIFMLFQQNRTTLRYITIFGILVSFFLMGVLFLY